MGEANFNEYSNSGTISQTYQSQDFTFRKPFIDYILNHITSSKLYLKLVKTCKFLFLKNPISVIPCLIYGKTFWVMGMTSSFLPTSSAKISLTQIKHKIWLTESLQIAYSPPSNIASSLIPYLYRCDANVIFLADQIITINELKVLGSSAVKCTLYNTKVKNLDGSDVSFFSILQQFTNLKKLFLHGQNFFTGIEKVDMKDVLKLSSKLDNFNLHQIIESFDIESFYECLKSFKSRTSILLNFDDEGDEAYGNRLNAIADDILATKFFTYLPPYMGSAFLSREKQLALTNLIKNLPKDP